MPPSGGVLEIASAAPIRGAQLPPCRATRRYPPEFAATDMKFCLIDNPDCDGDKPQEVAFWDCGGRLTCVQASWRAQRRRNHNPDCEACQ